MKKSLFLLIYVALSWVACKNGNGEGVQETHGGPNSDLVRNPATANFPTDTNQLARITYEQDTYDFGTVNEGQIVDHVFKFKNTGNVPLTILKARSSCGCTIPEWPEAPIPPGGTGEIKAKFNTEGKGEQQKKVITVTANTYPNDTRVTLMGTVNSVKTH